MTIKELFDTVTPEDEAVAAEARALLTRTPRPSVAQAKVLTRMQAGGRLALDPKTGRYTLTEKGKVTQLDQRPILAMLQNGILFQDLGGFCRQAP